MDRIIKSFDWTQAQAFLMTAETGSFSAAADKLGLSQPTIGRHVAALEDDLGVSLFDRVGKSVVLTENGLSILAHVKMMREAADQMTLTATGHVQSIAGKVSVTASDTLCAHNLPQIVSRLRKAHPEIEVEIISSNEVQDLRRREADIAIRHVRPSQPELIAKRVRSYTAHLFGATSYLDQIGRPQSPSEIGPNVQFIGLNSSDQIRLMLNSLGFSLEPRQFMVTTNSGVTGWEMVKAGIGLSMMFKEVTEQTNGIEMILPEIVNIECPIWLVTHRELHTSQRMRIVYDFIANAIGPQKPNKAQT